MTRQKSFKSRVRTRMDKTGEKYTTARRQLRGETSSAPAPEEVAGSASVPEEPAAPLGSGTGPDAEGVKPMRLPEAQVRERTGRGWDEWFSLLDDWGATSRNHTEIARWLVTEHQVPGWWAQSVTVTYEQQRGMREPGQKSDGYFSAGGTRTVAVPVDRLFDAFADSELRERWLPDVAVKVRTATAPKTFRADWLDDGTRLVVTFAPKGEAKSVVAVQHEKLANSDTAGRIKAYWRDRLSALKRFLEA